MCASCCRSHWLPRAQQQQQRRRFKIAPACPGVSYQSHFSWCRRTHGMRTGHGVSATSIVWSHAQRAVGQKKISIVASDLLCKSALCLHKSCALASRAGQLATHNMQYTAPACAAGYSVISQSPRSAVVCSCQMQQRHVGPCTVCTSQKLLYESTCSESSLAAT